MGALRRAAWLSMVVALAPAALAAPLGEETARFRHYSDTEGLGLDAVEALLLDRRGFLWLGTSRGLFRFDGYQFKAFGPGTESSSHLAANHILALLEDRGGRLWVGAEEGLTLFDRATSAFTDVHLDDGDAAVTSLLEDSQGRLWIGTAGSGVCSVEPARLEVVCRGPDPQASGAPSFEAVTDLAESEDGSLWVATFDTGLSRVEPASWTTRTLRHDPADEGSLSSDRINTLYRDRKGDLWVGTYDAGLNHIDEATGIVTRYGHDPSDRDSLGDNAVKTILEDKEGDLWVGLWGGGLDKLDRATGRFEHHRFDEDDTESLSDDRVLALAEDTLGQLWIGTQYGLDVLDPAPPVFRLYRHRPRDEGSLVSNRVRSVIEDRQGRVWVGTYNRGVTRFDSSTGEVRHFSHDPDDPRSLAHDGVWAFHEDAEGRLWLGTSNGLNRWDPETERFVRYQRTLDDPWPFSGANALSVWSSSAGELWVGTWGRGLNRFDPSTGECTQYLPDNDDPGKLPEAAVWSILEDDQGQTWVGTGKGLARLNPDGETFTRFMADPADPSSLVGHAVNHILEDSSGRLWIGTSEGLDRWAPAQGGFDRLPETEGIDVKSVQEESPGVLWLGTDRGLARLDTGAGSLTWFDETDGLQGYRFTIGVAARGPSGSLYFGGPGGLTGFDPNDLGAPAPAPAVALTELLLLNSPVRPGGDSPLRRDIGHTSSLVLEPSQYSFSLEFTALSFRRPEKTLYEYKLEGIDPGWISTDARLRRATYTGLPPGDYTFQVRASNQPGVWSDPGVALDVTVLAPWWRTGWFRAVVGVGLLGLAVAVLRWRTVALRRRNLKLEELVALRTAELQDSNRRLEEASLTDPLTGLRNRRFLGQYLENDLSRVMREHHGGGSGEPSLSLVAVLMDLDHFKSINDTYGHAAGDAVLQQVAHLLRAQSRASDLTLRWGGEEFLVVARFIEPARAFETADRIRRAVAETPMTLGDGRTLRITCSSGVATFPFLEGSPEAVPWERVVDLADQGLNAAKRAGRNTTIQVLGTESTEAQALESRLAGDFDVLVREGQLKLESSAPSAPQPTPLL